MSTKLFVRKCLLIFKFEDLTSTTGKGKFLMAAKRVRRGAHIEYIISLDADDLSQGNSAYVGKLRYFYEMHSFRITFSVSWTQL
jgi:hypothetical protein